MTSNHTENIDPALLRPGRIDFTIKFGLATSDTATTLFTQMYDAPGVEGEGPEAEKAIGRGGVAASTSLTSQALEFGKKIPDLTLSPAAIQGFLLTHQNVPDGAIAACDGWVQQPLNQKETEISVPEVVSESGEGSSDSEGDDDGDDGSDVRARR
ncbi:hypothetical protein B0J13DRAFT_631238 [Dactylonectria estremocensis]|uniref:Mitochondrial chaperone BCS1-like ATPase lid domain-containing protein n=1 Tax=Dactylonectria estremocensis TaxID=1079267 RepID=A0A9P9D3Y6_9HYPO|nr:hypothetical protein B0J13DRAFT_631238 [Dactylonectria estremocensis]